jgi:site-specific DNA-cytosine methylase
VLEETARIADKAATIPRPTEKKGKLQWSTSGCIMGDGWSIAWRVHDAQFWGVPQRRKRIALVADFAGGGAPEILFERESLPGNTTESGETRKDTATDARAGIDKAITFQERGGRPGGGKGILIQNDRTGALSTVNNQMVFDASRRHDYQQFEDVCETDITCLNDQGGSIMSVSENVVGALRAQEHGHQPIVFEPGAASRVGGHVYEDKAGTVRANAGDNQQAVVYGISSYNSNAMKSDNPNSGIYEAETSRTLDLNGGNPACNQGGMVVCVGNGQLAQAKLSEKVGTLNCMHDQQALLINTKGNDNAGTQSVHGCSIVRRLTPLEAERLQGYPVIRKVRFTEMTKDEYIAWNINEGHIIVDTECGKIFATRGPGGIKLGEPKELTGSIVNGYRVVSIRNGDTKMQCRVHRRVWITKHGIIPDGYVIDHINNTKQDNRLCNLQLLTSAENS